MKNTDTIEKKGYDTSKKVSGIKRHIAFDTLGFPHAIIVTTANISDREGAIKTVEEHWEDLTFVEKTLVDVGHRGEKYAENIHHRIGAVVEVVKRNELHSFKAIPQRWVVECSFG